MSKILALEGEWENNPKYKIGIGSILKFIEEVTEVDYHHRRVATESDFFFYLKKGSYKSFSIIYFAFHGERNKIILGNNKHQLTLDEIAEGASGVLKDKIVHFGSCSTLKIKKQDLIKFKKVTGAKIVSGYTKDIGFVDSSIFDIAYFTLLFKYERKAHVDSRMQKDYPGLYKRLGFVFLS